MEDLLLPDPLHLPQLNSQRWLRQLQQRYKIKRHLQGIIPLTWFYSNDICHHGFSRSKYFHLLFLLVQNRQQTQDLIWSGANGLGIQKWVAPLDCHGIQIITFLKQIYEKEVVALWTVIIIFLNCNCTLKTFHLVITTNNMPEVLTKYLYFLIYKYTV